DELRARMWVNASRTDVQIGIRVVLPRSLDPQRRGQATAIVRGTVYDRPGQWQVLNISDVSRLLADQVRVLRTMPGASIDSHEAFVDAVVLIVPGNQSAVEVGTDDLQVDGVLLSAEAGAVHPYGETLAAARLKTPMISRRANSIVGAAVLNPGMGPVSATNDATVRLDGATLLVDGKPFLPRVIQWNGETMQFLSGCGFNVIQLPTAPTAEQVADAERFGLWFLSTPPHPEAIARQGAGRPGDRVLAWQLQDDALEVDPNYASRWAELVREKDAIFGRPVVIAPQSRWATISDTADILVARHPRSGLLSPTEFQTWFTACAQKSKPGTPLWVSLTTQCDDSTRRQLNALTHVACPYPCVDARRLETSALVACANGARGFVFQSASLLSDTDEYARQRATTLRLINRRLQLIEPWLASGKVIERVGSSDGSHTGIVLYVDRARLLIPIPNGGAPQFNPAAGAARSNDGVTFVVPGVPETCQVFYLSPAAMRILESERVAGGTKVTLPRGEDGFILITEDPTVIQSLRQRIARDGTATVQLERDLAAAQARELTYAGQKLAQLGYNSALSMQEVASANQQIAQVDSLLAGGQVERAHSIATTARQQLERTVDEQQRLVAPSAAFDSNPLALYFGTLPEFAALQRAFGTVSAGDNLLLGGDFEDLAQMTKSGWQNVTNPVPGVQASAQLSAVEPQHGTYCLVLSATAAAVTERPSILSNLIWVVSPPMPVDQNQIVEITGWVEINQSFASGDGLVIVDSLGGPSLSLVINQTTGWQPFRIIRAAPEPAKFHITFALAGLGTAKVDAVMVRTLAEPIARRLPPAAPPMR
ncbi:MAG TPA: hypothetical protein VHE81_01460, partial [Lacipirellulaceae bacterium]|nr:hypothetical protein [Lacipirellulaceae bacterium]